MRREFNEFGVHIGYRPGKNVRTDYDLPSRESTPSIAVCEMEANAGTMGASITSRLYDDQRDARASRKLAPEDFIERAMEKVRIWTRPAPGRGDRAVRVYPKEAACK